MNSTLWNRFETNAIRHPHKAALIYFQKGDWKTVTYTQLLDSAQRFASGLLACHLTPGMRAALMTPASADFFAFTFALLKLGIVPVLVDPAIGLKKVSECFKESQPDIFIGNTLTHSLRKVFGWGKETIKHNLTIEQVKRQKSNVEDFIHPSREAFIVQNSSPAAIIYTSGSTGSPKGVLYTQANFAAQMDMLANTFEIAPDEIDLPAFPLYALIDTLLGVTSVIPDITFPVPGKTNPKKVIHAIQKFNVTNMFASPVVLDILVNSQPQPAQFQKLHSLKRVITAGAPATIQLQENFRRLLSDETNLFGTYGATESLPIAKIESREIFEVKNKSAQGAGVCLGRPVTGAEVRIIKISDTAIETWQADLEVKSNVVGEITVKGAAVTESYIAREEATRLAKIKDGDDIIHRLGDVGYFDEQGRLWYCGRKAQRVTTIDDVLFTEQIEGIFNIHPLVCRSALVGVEHEPVLWIELKQNSKNADKEKIKHELTELAKEHPQASNIKEFLFMKKFPTDVRHNSKIIREELVKYAVRRLRNSRRALILL